jgi:hypothetical protein
MKLTAGGDRGCQFGAQVLSEASWPRAINHQLLTASARLWPMKSRIIFSPVGMDNGNWNQQIL